MTGLPAAGRGLADAWSGVAVEYLRHIVPGLLPSAGTLCDLAGAGAGARVLDIACGPGTAAFLALERGAAGVTGVDYAPGMISLARARAARHPSATFVVGDAAFLPVPDAAFDVAISSFGLIFAPDPGLAVREMARALRPGGRFGILAWLKRDTTEDYYEAVYRHLPRPLAPHDPYGWGVEEQARAWLDPVAKEIAFEPVQVPFTTTSPRDAWGILKRSTGRIAAQYGELAAAAQVAMDRDLEAWFDQWRLVDGTMLWPRRAHVIHGAILR